jgi:hypothetical protein
VNANLDRLAVGLLARDLLDVNDVLAAVDGNHFALNVLEGAADDANLVVLAHGHRAHTVLLSQLLRQARRHDLAAQV